MSTKPANRCSHCGAEAYNLKLCARCKGVRYCNKICQTSHWPTHKAACKEPTPTTNIQGTQNNDTRKKKKDPHHKYCNDRDKDGIRKHPPYFDFEKDYEDNKKIHTVFKRYKKKYNSVLLNVVKLDCEEFDAWAEKNLLLEYLDDLLYMSHDKRYLEDVTQSNLLVLYFIVWFTEEQLAPYEEKLYEFLQRYYVIAEDEIDIHEAWHQAYLAMKKGNIKVPMDTRFFSKLGLRYFQDPTNFESGKILLLENLEDLLPDDMMDMALDIISEPLKDPIYRDPKFIATISCFLVDKKAKDKAHLIRNAFEKNAVEMTNAGGYIEAMDDLGIELDEENDEVFLKYLEHEDKYMEFRKVFKEEEKRIGRRMDKNEKVKFKFNYSKSKSAKKRRN